VGGGLPRQFTFPFQAAGDQVNRAGQRRSGAGLASRRQPAERQPGYDAGHRDTSRFPQKGIDRETPPHVGSLPPQVQVFVNTHFAG
jgi:hypothetical protein